jgi:enamine deaminase RidA (YjgF/YER057c/UK114 family)
MTDGQSKSINFVNPPELAPPPGYSHVAEIRGGRIVFIAGQVALDRQGNLVGKGDFEAQTNQVFRNIAAALASVGCTPSHVAKLTIFVRDANQLQSYRKARDRFLGGVTPPASTLVEVSRLALEDLLIEIEAVAVAN